MTSPFQHQSLTLTDVAPALLRDTAALAAAIVAAAGAIGIANDVPPVVRASGSSASTGGTVGALSPDGHIVLHTAPELGLCLVDVVARTPAPVSRGIEVIARRLGARVPGVPTPG